METPDDFSFHETVHAHGWRDLDPFRWQGDTGTLERIERTTNGEIRRISIRDTGVNRLEIETDGKADAAEIRAMVRRILQLDVNIQEFHAYCAARDHLAAIPGRRQGRMLRGASLWEDTVKVILTTNTTWAQTKSMTRRFVAEWGDCRADDSDCRAFPTPERIAALELSEFADRAKVGYRAAALHELAAAIVGGLELEDWNRCDLPTDALRKRLLALRGVGPYAAACLLLYLGRPDRVNSDSWARTLVGRELGRPVSDAEVHAFFEPYGAWRGLVYHFYPWRSPDPATKG